MPLSPNQASSLDADIVTPPVSQFGPIAPPITDPGVSTRDGCRIFRYINAFVVDQGVRCLLRYTFRDPNTSAPLDLIALLGIDDPAAPPPPDNPRSTAGDSRSLAFVERKASFELRVQEWTAYGPSTVSSRVTAVACTPENLRKGTVLGTLPRDLAQVPGIYTMNWVVRDHEGQPVMLRRSFLSVERSSLADDGDGVRQNYGAPTIGEIRAELVDSPGDNVLIEGYEFSDDQLLAAIAKPVAMWNEEPPPIGCHTTKTFPYRNAWINCTIGYLHEFAANYYRRNKLTTTAGGVTVDDKNREREYMADSQRRIAEYRDWLTRKKIEINLAGFYGHLGSSYARLGIGSFAGDGGGSGADSGGELYQ